MKKLIFIILFLALQSSFVCSQENTPLLCSDGIDNDGDGLLDCEDDECFNLSNNGCETCLDNGLSFADVVLSKNLKCPFNTNKNSTNALGVSNSKSVSLGEGGYITLGFTNNLIINSGNEDPDVWIFEVGPEVEASRIELKPCDQNTIDILISEEITDLDNDGYYEFGTISGSTAFLDIDSKVSGYNFGELKFESIQIIDIPQFCGFGSYPGADIDAVCALSSLDVDCSIVDCSGTPDGTSIIDECGVCLELNDPNFNESCKDCNGIINGTSVLDECGVCLEINDPEFNQSCIDCSGVPNGTTVLDECGLCLEPTDPEFNQSCADCLGTPNGSAILDECGICLEPSDPEFNQSCSDCLGTPNGSAILDECGICLEPTDPEFNQSCADCLGTPNGTAIFDECGICLYPTDPEFNQSCTDCLGTPNGSAILDECGICLEPSDPDFNQSCADCLGTPNGEAILDECEICLIPTDPDFNQSCADCLGTPNGIAILDECGECFAPNDPLFNQSCSDCLGTPNGSAILDDCGECYELNDVAFNTSCLDCAGVVNGNSVIDNCGLCLEPSDVNFNLSCSEDVYLPNVFTPNNDGINDLFVLSKRSIINATILDYRIYNRWGELLYQSSNFDFQNDTKWWDGTFKGNRLNSGIYIYYVEIAFNNTTIKNYNGTVAIIN